MHGEPSGSENPPDTGDDKGEPELEKGYEGIYRKMRGKCKIPLLQQSGGGHDPGYLKVILLTHSTATIDYPALPSRLESTNSPPPH